MYLRDVRVIDEFFRLESHSNKQLPVLACPTKTSSGYKFCSAIELDILVDRAARCLCARGLNVQNRATAPTVGILGPTNLGYLMIACGLSRLGYTALILSPRLSLTAYVALIKETSCKILLSSSQRVEVLSQLKSSISISILDLIDEDEVLLENPHLPLFQIPSSSLSDKSLTAYVMHSSGSTGLPKPIYQSHQRYISNASNGFGLSAFVTLPLYHAYGFGAFYRALVHGTLLILYDGSIPVTGKNMVQVIETLRPQQVSTVPYSLKLISEEKGGIEALRSYKIVAYHGSPCPVELGDRLSENGIHIVGHLGSTEAGALATTMRPRGDDNWNYFRFLPSVKPHLWMKPLGTGDFELVCLDSLPTKVISNSDEPLNSLHTRDLFEPHPKISEAWKYLGRIDDRITLLNGEKILPLPIEGLIQDNPLVQEAVVFGINRAVPGILIFKSHLADEMSSEAFLGYLWPTIERANKKAEAFSQIGKDLVIVLSAGVKFPKTDNGSLIRLTGYQKFHKEIEESYHRVEISEGTLALGLSIESALDPVDLRVDEVDDRLRRLAYVM
ncbi:hypothetical protein G7Y89_g13303 [Cudoniella acicularis]|uniref:AMP-dependent synthetase/ligase domain-containing protein n=1 Tax=Cudoniella acicularis TaxID=354080 RepID=A0A8H4VWK2_9HELO|nr:hypothetical protein G7Y89_g13303 [Cudoniella acicularis]